MDERASEGPDAEAPLRRAFGEGRLDDAMSAAIRAYGPELLGYMTAVLRDEDWARDAFAQLCEDLWKGFARFEWRSSFRTWAYRAARNAVVRERARTDRPRRLDTEELERLPSPPASTTRPHLASENVATLARLRDSLDPDEQTLLTLRIDRGMAWREIAEVLADGVALEDPTRAAATMRKRFDRLTERLRAATREPDEG